jgi:hypothetical protein
MFFSTHINTIKKYRTENHFHLVFSWTKPIAETDEKPAIDRNNTDNPTNNPQNIDDFINAKNKATSSTI